MAHDDMGEAQALPEGWVRAKVGEIYDIVGGGTPSTQVEDYWQGSIPWISSADIHGPKDIKPRRGITQDAIKNSATNLVPAGSLIVVTRVGLGKVALTDAPLCFSQDSQALVGSSDVVFPDYAIYYLSQAVQRFKHQSRGTTIAGVTKKQLLDLPFILAPLPEQRRIVAEIETQLTRLEAGVAALKRAQARLRRYKAAVLKAACEGRLVPTEAELARRDGVTPPLPYEPASILLQRILAERRTRWQADHPGKPYHEPTPPDTSDLPELPEGWVWIALDVVADVVDPHPSHRTPPEFEDGIPYVGMGDITKDGTINRNGARKVAREVIEEHKGRYQLKTGDFVFGKIGTLGKPVRLTEPFDYALSANIILIQPNAELVDLEFAYTYMASPLMEALLREGSRATTQAAFGIIKARRLPFPLPPLAEQHRIVAEVERRLSVVGELGKQVEAALGRAERLRQAILKRAFEGRLAPQDPNDEPASALLERIRAGRGAEKLTGQARQLRLAGT